MRQNKGLDLFLRESDQIVYIGRVLMICVFFFRVFRRRRQSDIREVLQVSQMLRLNSYQRQVGRVRYAVAREESVFRSRR